MIGRLSIPCMNLCFMYRWFGVVPQGLDVLSPVVLGGDFRSPLLKISLGCFRDLSLGDLMGEICGNPSWFFGEDHVWFEDRWMVASLCDE
jgi:hypothetical protein